MSWVGTLLEIEGKLEVGEGPWVPRAWSLVDLLPAVSRLWG